MNIVIDPLVLLRLKIWSLANDLATSLFTYSIKEGYVLSVKEVK